MNESIRKTTYERENLALPQIKPHILKKIHSSSDFLVDRCYSRKSSIQGDWPSNTSCRALTELGTCSYIKNSWFHFHIISLETEFLLLSWILNWPTKVINRTYQQDSLGPKFTTVIPRVESHLACSTTVIIQSSWWTDEQFWITIQTSWKRHYS
jgi:hypothetical protein